MPRDYPERPIIGVAAEGAGTGIRRVVVAWRRGGVGRSFGGGGST
jgi:hypothetical protein